MLHLLQMGPSKVLTTFPFQIQSFWCCPPCRNTVTSSSVSSDLYTSTIQTGPPSANAALPPHPPLQLLYFLSSHPVHLICIQESNLNSFSSSGFLDSLLCVLITPTPGLVFSLVMPRMLAAASSFSSGKAYFSLNFLPSCFLRLISTLIV